MKKYITINDRTYSQLEEYCKSNKIDLQEYMSNSVRNQLYIDIYGDMNQLRGEEPVKTEPPKKEEEKRTVICDNIEEIILNKDTEQIIIVDNNDKKHIYGLNILKIVEKSKTEEFASDNTSRDKTVRIKRQIQTK